jgi:hypothetical protein
MTSGSYHPVGFLADPRYLVPVDVAVEADPDPATVADIRRPEESVGFRARQLLLGTRRRGAPEVREAGLMVPVRPQHDELPADEESRRTMT